VSVLIVMAEIQVELLKASYGDCIFININYDSKSFVIMIDGEEESEEA